LYFIQTCGELCLSPIGLSLVGKLSPKRFASLLYGVFFLSNASGYALAGTLGSILPATGDAFEKASQLGIDLRGVLDKKVTLTSEQLKLLAENNIAATNPAFAGFEIHNLFEFFMVFVVLTGIASVILFAITPKLKKMMHGVR
jgi:POT family proton-dependent oligopeptide transporter